MLGEWLMPQIQGDTDDFAWAQKMGAPLPGLHDILGD